MTFMSVSKGMTASVVSKTEAQRAISQQANDLVIEIVGLYKELGCLSNPIVSVPNAGQASGPMQNFVLPVALRFRNQRLL